MKMLLEVFRFGRAFRAIAKNPFSLKVSASCSHFGVFSPYCSRNGGTGKTHACLALGLAACQRGFSVAFLHRGRARSSIDGSALKTMELVSEPLEPKGNNATISIPVYPPVPEPLVYHWNTVFLPRSGLSEPRPAANPHRRKAA
jgi:hypothetical protein